jgi:ABC-type antimicrobial peptide transport system permease subunit
MNWKLIFLLSLLGVAIGVASLFGLTASLNPRTMMLIIGPIVGVLNAIAAQPTSGCYSRCNRQFQVDQTSTNKG